jgi:methionine-rich copper-binding protein CopC
MRVGGALIAASVLVAAGPSSAHSLLLESSPAAGAVVAVPPDRITLTFNNRIEKPLSKIRLVETRGQVRDLAVVVVDGPPERLTVTVPRLAPGDYRVEWQVLSTDGHVVSGRFSFRFRP